MLYALTTPESLELAVAVGTGLLAIATFVLALQARSQANATVRLAQAAEQELAVRSTPILRVMRLEAPGRADIATVNKGRPDESLTVRYENRGPAPAEPESFTMTPGGRGELAEAGVLMAPVIESGGEADVNFHPSDQEQERHATGAEVLVQVVYQAVGSGVRYRMQCYVKRHRATQPEHWEILRELGPDPLD